jgi:Carboxypeptidase regulatory-like domain/TonB dependent receptor-like, beta-barrel
MGRRQGVFAWMLLVALTMMLAGRAAAQVNTATLSGTVIDPQGQPVKAAKVAVTNLATGVERTTVTNDDGYYNLLSLAPGTYKLTVEGGKGFAPFTDQNLGLSVGQNAAFNVQLKLGSMEQSVTVTSEAAAIETTKTEVSQIVGERRIENLPINGRNYINFTLTNSQVTRDAAPAIGPAPTSGLSIGGQRSRANMVTIDGANAVDDSVSGIRSTVSQEDVQEFQMILSNYNAEYGQATGGVINIVTKSGGNENHGDVFGYFRNKAFQARNAFSGQVDPATGNLDPVKQPYTRVQAGFAFGGPIKKDKTFYFLSYEYTQREETGFSSIGQGNFGLQNFTYPFFPAPLALTPAQGSAVNTLLGTGNPALQNLAAQYAVLMGSASSVALNGLDYGAVVSQISGGSITPANPVSTPGGTLFQEFPLPVSCPPGQTVNALQCSGFAAIGANSSVIPAGAVPLPGSFVGLNSIRGNFPEKEKTSLWSLRLDHHWSNRNTSFLRVGVSPSEVTGLQTTAQNQVFGQNAGSRVGEQHYRDVSATFQHDTILSDRSVNTFRFQFARRGLHFGFSPLPGGDQIAVNVPGYAYFGREPYSTVDRIERRFEWTDNVSISRGGHTFKLGGDVNFIQLRSAKQQIFTLDFGGLANFGGLAASTFGLPDSVNLGAQTLLLPGTTGLQSYGLGIPTTYIQGIGQSNEPFDDIPFGFFAQDSWRVNRKLALNYGVRYDVEISPLFAPATAVNAAAEKALGVTEGIPRDYNNVAPRFGLAWDPAGDGKMVIRAGYGIFYDNPLLAIAFDSVTADGGRSVQLISAGGTPSACGLVTAACGGGLDSPTNLNGSSIFQGVLNALPSMGYLPNQQRFDPFFPNSLFSNQNYLTAGFPLPILPFTLPVQSNFVYGYAQQANLTIGRQIAGSWKFSVGYQYTHGSHLNKPVDINSTDPVLLTQNLFNADAAGLGYTSPVTVTAPASTVGPTASTCGIGVVAPSVLGQLFGCPAPLSGLNGQYVSTPAFFNFFRPSGPNPSFAGLVPGGYGTQVQLAGLAGYPVGFGVPVPFNSVDTQQSTGSSVYHGLTVTVQKSFSHGLEMLSSYTWSHAIDDSTDLESTLEPQDSRFPAEERSNSDFDQRHRWVTSAVFQTGSANTGDSAWRHFSSGFTFAPIIELSSGRPYTVITGTDYRLDLGSSNGRPSVGASTGLPTATSPFLPGVTFTLPNVCLTNSGQSFSVLGVAPPAGCDGNLGRNPFTTPGFFQIDLRVAKRIPIGERMSVDLIADSFNLLNRTNVIAVNQLCDPGSSSTCFAGQPTAAADARQFQFALKLNW